MVVHMPESGRWWGRQGKGDFGSFLTAIAWNAYVLADALVSARLTMSP